MKRAYALALLLLLPATRAVAEDASAESAEIALAQRRADRHLLRVQQERFEADARGDEPRKLKRLEREFQRTQVRRRELARAAAQAEHSD